MALAYRIFQRSCQSLYPQLTKPVRCSVGINNNLRLRVAGSGICFRTYSLQQFTVGEINSLQQFTVGKIRLPNSVHLTVRQCATNPSQPTPPEPPQKPGVVQRFKKMARDYWYVLLPVHLATSAVWFGIFYYAVRSGVDIIGLLQSLGISEKIIEPLKDSKAGYVALAYALYKIATPIRYTVTLGGTTYAIRKLTSLGWIKPVPSRERLKEIYHEKKDNLQDRFSESTIHYQTQMKAKQGKVMEEMRRYKDEMQRIKDKMRKM